MSRCLKRSLGSCCRLLFDRDLKGNIQEEILVTVTLLYQRNKHNMFSAQCAMEPDGTSLHKQTCEKPNSNVSFLKS